MWYSVSFCPAGQSAYTNSIPFRDKYGANITWTLTDGYDFVFGLSRKQAFADGRFCLNLANYKDAAILVCFK